MNKIVIPLVPSQIWSTSSLNVSLTFPPLLLYMPDNGYVGSCSYMKIKSLYPNAIIWSMYFQSCSLPFPRQNILGIKSCQIFYWYQCTIEIIESKRNHQQRFGTMNVLGNRIWRKFFEISKYKNCDKLWLLSGQAEYHQVFLSLKFSCGSKTTRVENKITEHWFIYQALNKQKQIAIVSKGE